MTEIEVNYMLGRLDVHIQRDPEYAERKGFLLTVIRRCTPRFIEQSAIARCPDMANAQALARIIVGVEFDNQGAAIWPDGRTEQPDPREIIAGLVEWAAMMGGWDNPVWDEASTYLEGNPFRGDPVSAGCPSG